MIIHKEKLLIVTGLRNLSPIERFGEISSKYIMRCTDVYNQHSMLYISSNINTFTKIYIKISKREFNIFPHSHLKFKKYNSILLHPNDEAV